MLRPFEGDRPSYDQLPAVDVSSRTIRLLSLWTIHGRVMPDIHAWRPGDIVLSSSAAIHPIMAYQQLLYPGSPASGWTHVGMYDGTGFVWDANPRVHVQERSVGAYLIGKRAVALIRPRNFEITTEDLGPALVDWVRARYDLISLTDRLLARVARLGAKDPVEEGSLVCSTFLDRVLLHAGGRHYFPALPVVVPADFASSDQFEPVPLAWHRPVARQMSRLVEAALT